MPTPTQRGQRRNALSVARAAVRAYARDPSDANAHGIELAWRRVRQIDSLAPWRLLTRGAGLPPGARAAKQV